MSDLLQNSIINVLYKLLSPKNVYKRRFYLTLHIF